MAGCAHHGQTDEEDHGGRPQHQQRERGDGSQRVQEIGDELVVDDQVLVWTRGSRGNEERVARC